MSYVLELQPDATYKVRYKKSEKGKKRTKDLTFSEFYKLIELPSKTIQIQLAQHTDFSLPMSLENQLSLILNDLYNYDEWIYLAITKEDLVGK